MLERHTESIAAIATAPGRGAVGIVRVSGKAVAAVMAAVCGKQLVPRQATYLPFRANAADTLGGNALANLREASQSAAANATSTAPHGVQFAQQAPPIDQGLALYFPAPHSYTGEDVLELQAHGGTVVLRLLLARCLEAGRAQGLRIAAPGEFTERAYLNDKIDLAQAEAVADLIDASTEAAARSASRSLGGAFSNEIKHLSDAIVQLRMLVEATLDFPEEEIDHLSRGKADAQVAGLRQQLASVCQRAVQGALLREGIQVVIAGQPNAGKSSLLNALAGAELAIVTPIAGTTRDKVQQTIQIEGVPIHIIDTAGLRESDDEVEKIGIARAWEAIRGADAVLFLHDVSRENAPEYRANNDHITLTLVKNLPKSVPILHVDNKIDLAQTARRSLAVNTHFNGGASASARENASAEAADHAGVHAHAQANLDANPERLQLSAKTGQGLDVLRARLLAIAGWQSGAQGLFIARERHVQALRRAQAHMEAAAEHLGQEAANLDLMAEDLRLAHNSLGSITGAMTADDLLGEIFSRFCIGK